MEARKKILIAPLDWGLGHATRCVPIIQQLHKAFEVLLAGTGRSGDFLQQTFPELTYIDFPGYDVTYPSSDGKHDMAVKMLGQGLKVQSRIRQENRLLKQLIKEHQIDLVISDNRFGLYTNLVPSIYITHQIQIWANRSWQRKLLYDHHQRYIRKYSACWIPDHPESPLSGQLSDPTQPSSFYEFIGPLSRFEPDNQPAEKRYDYCILLSGLEPQRTRLEEKLLNIFQGSDYKVILFQGKPEQQQNSTNGSIEIHNHGTPVELAKAIRASECTIVRSGYSSIMDLSVLQTPCLFIPTPGQTEQEYLAKHLFDRDQIPYLSQKDLTLDQIVNSTKKPVSSLNNTGFDFVKAVKKWL